MKKDEAVWNQLNPGLNRLIWFAKVDQPVETGSEKEQPCDKALRQNITRTEDRTGPNRTVWMVYTQLCYIQSCGELQSHAVIYDKRMSEAGSRKPQLIGAFQISEGAGGDPPTMFGENVVNGTALKPGLDIRPPLGRKWTETQVLGDQD